MACEQEKHMRIFVQKTLWEHRRFKRISIDQLRWGENLNEQLQQVTNHVEALLASYTEAVNNDWREEAKKEFEEVCKMGNWFATARVRVWSNREIVAALTALEDRLWKGVAK